MSAPGVRGDVLSNTVTSPPAVKGTHDGDVIDPVSMGKYGYERISSGLVPVVRITGPVSMD